MENPANGLFCMGCGTRFDQETTGATSQVPTPFSSSYQQPYTPSSAGRGVQPVQDVPPVREKYGDIIFSSSYNYLVIGALIFGLAPLISIGISMFLGVLTQESEALTFLTSLVDPICFGIFIYGIYSISQSNPSSVNAQLQSVPIYLAVYVIGSFFANFLFNDFLIAETSTLEEVRSMVLQGIGIVVIDFILSIFLLLGALKFTSWFEDFVLMLGGPYNAPTGRFKWFGILMVVSWGLLLLSFFTLLSAVDTLSYETVDTSMLFLSIAAFVIFAALILQIASGYKIYSTLNNIRQGKYDGTYQAQVTQKYQ